MPLRIVIPAATTYDDVKGKFYDRAERAIVLEHSLLSMSLWEAEYKQCFLLASLDSGMFRYYIRCMCDEVLSDEELNIIENKYQKCIVNYMFDNRFAVKKLNNKPKASRNQSQKMPFIPTEKIYHTMFERGVPLACEKWHFSRLMSLLGIYADADAKQNKGKGHGKMPKKKMSPDQYARMAEINRSRLNNGG